MAGEEFYVAVLALVLLVVLVYFISIRGNSVFSFFGAVGNYEYIVQTRNNPDGIKTLVSETNKIMAMYDIKQNGKPLRFVTNSVGNMSDGIVEIYDPQGPTEYGKMQRVLISYKRNDRGEVWNTQTNVNTRVNKFITSDFFDQIRRADNAENLIFYNNKFISTTNNIDNTPGSTFRIWIPEPSDLPGKLKNMDRARYVRDTYNGEMRTTNPKKQSKNVRFMIAPTQDVRAREGTIISVLPGVFNFQKIYSEKFEDIDAKKDVEMKKRVRDYVIKERDYW